MLFKMCPDRNIWGKVDISVYASDECKLVDCLKWNGLTVENNILIRKHREPNLHYQNVGIVYNVKGVWLFYNFNTSQHKVVSMSEMHMCTILLLLNECIRNNLLWKISCNQCFTVIFDQSYM